jgi:uncharacterized protein
MSTTPTDKRRRGPRCPICGEPADPVFRPFCSKRCADVDLSRWLKGSYAIPGRSAVGEDDDLEGPDPSKTSQKRPANDTE